MEIDTEACRIRWLDGENRFVLRGPKFFMRSCPIKNKDLKNVITKINFRSPSHLRFIQLVINLLGQLKEIEEGLSFRS